MATSPFLRLAALTSLRAFEAAARLQSFKLAAEELAVTPTAISHRIRALESELGCGLFVRRTRAVSLTDQGRLLHAAVREGFEAMARGVDALRAPQRPRVSISTTPAFAAKWLVPRLASFQRAHPGVDLHVHASNEPVDLQGGCADLAIRYGLGPYPGLHAVTLLRDRFAPVASPALNVRKAADMARQTLIHFDWFSAPPVALDWAAWAQAARVRRLDTSAGTRYSEESHAIQAAVAGQGVALLSLVLVEQELAQGLLEARVGPALEGLAYHLLRAKTVPGRPEVKAVETWLRRMAASSA